MRLFATIASILFVSLFMVNCQSTAWVGDRTVGSDSSIEGTKETKENPDSGYPAEATVNGKYANLLQVVTCPKDQASYGKFYHWGKWTGKAWCGQKVQSGYWVYVAPNWYIWKDKVK